MGKNPLEEALSIDSLDQVYIAGHHIDPKVEGFYMLNWNQAEQLIWQVGEGADQTKLREVRKDVINGLLGELLELGEKDVKFLPLLNKSGNEKPESALAYPLGLPLEARKKLQIMLRRPEL